MNHLLINDFYDLVHCHEGPRILTEAASVSFTVCLTAAIRFSAQPTSISVASWSAWASKVTKMVSQSGNNEMKPTNFKYFSYKVGQSDSNTGNLRMSWSSRNFPLILALIFGFKGGRRVARSSFKGTKRDYCNSKISRAKCGFLLLFLSCPFFSILFRFVSFLFRLCFVFVSF